MEAYYFKEFFNKSPTAYMLTARDTNRQVLKRKKVLSS